ncbi:MAG: arabinosyltransferase C-terminal domain-containing protein, partial [Mycobacterium sp.]
PAVLTLVTLGTALAVLVGSFVAAQLRRPAGSLAMANLDRIAGGQVCGLADDIEVLPDGEVLRAAEPGGRVSGFAASTGFYPGAPPPDPPGSGTSEYLWGSRTPGAQATGEIVTGWFALPPLAPDTGVALSVSGRTSDGNSLVLEFGRADGPTVTVLGAAEPVDRPASDEDPAHPLWRSVGVDSAEVPAGADRVRIHAVDDRTGQAGWLAFTGPRLRTIVPLTDFLADRGPVLISWPQSFLFPGVRDIATVSGGVATTPRTVIESPRPWFTEDRDPDPGGTFAGLATFGQLNEVPSRLVGHPDVDWGSVLVSADPAVPDNADNYVRTTDRAVVWGAGATRGQRPEG